MESDPRQYIKVALDLITHSKVLSHPKPVEVVGAVVFAWTLCDQSMSDGHFSPATVRRLGGVDDPLFEYLVEVGLWHLPGHGCDRCPQPKPGWAYAHDFTLHQRTAAQRAEISAVRSKAARSRWHGKGARSNAKSSAKSSTTPSEDAASMQGGDPSTQPSSPVDAASFDPVDIGPELGQQALIDVGDATSNAEQSRADKSRATTKNIRSRDLEAAFDAWWKLYPRKVGRIKAREKWMKALTLPGVTVETLMTAVKAYAEDPQRDPQYTPHPATWLHQGRWSDGPPERPLALPGRTPNGRPTTDERVRGFLDLGRQLQQEYGK